jgi:hypothetical protein
MITAAGTDARAQMDERAAAGQRMK